MPNAYVKLDLDNNLDRDIRQLRARGAQKFSIFYINGDFIRTATDSRRGTCMHSSHANSLVGVYNRYAERGDILDDIKDYLDSLYGELPF